MKPRSIEVASFRGWHSSGPIALDAPLTVVVGDNGWGKSSLLLAIEWCLLGPAMEGATKAKIAERADFEIVPRDAPWADTVVTLSLTDARGHDVRVTRRRVVGGKGAAADELEVRRAGAPPLQGAAAEAYLAAHVTDAATWRRAHAFQADAARARLFEKGDRSAALAELLGLDAGGTAQEVLRRIKPSAYVGSADTLLRSLERDLLVVIERPRRDRDDAERRLATRGLSRADLGEARVAAHRHELVARARALAGRLVIEPDLPDPADADAVRRFATAWPVTARKQTPALLTLPTLRKEIAELETALASIEAPEKAYRLAQEEYRDEVAANGDRAARAAAHEAALLAKQATEEAQKQANALVALLDDASRLVTGPLCPVCGSEVAELAARLDAEVARRRGPDAATMAQARSNAAAAERDAVARVTRLEALLAKGQRLRAEWEKSQARLLAALSGATPGTDPVAAARTRLDALRAEALALEGLASARDEALGVHTRDADTLRDLEAWLASDAQIDRDVEVASLPSYPALTASLDALAGFVVDVETLAGLVRDVQADRSEDRRVEVNASLSNYYQLVVGDDPRGISVSVEPTPKGIKYELLDGQQRACFPVLNQAHLNALSIALLFAQAEARAKALGLAWVVLDDPAQSLDEARQVGLARAIEALARHVHVIVGTTDGVLAQRLASHVATEKRFLRLLPYDAAQGARVVAGGDDV